MRGWISLGLVVVGLTACDNGPTEVRELSEITDAAARAVGDYDILEAWAPAGQALAVDTQRVATRATAVPCAGNDPLARAIGLDGYVTLAEVNRIVTIVLVSYGTRCNDSTFVFHTTLVGQYVLQDRYLTVTSGGGGFFGAVIGEVNAQIDELPLDFGDPGISVFQAFASTFQIEYVSRIRARRRRP